MKDKINKFIKGKTILITGGTGSFGNSVVSKLLEFKPARVIIFSRDEKKQFDMRNKYEDERLRFVIGDVRERESLIKVMQNVDFVFHAAALKQVPTCEFFPMEAVKTNIIGANNVLEIAIESGVRSVVILSTDKAVYPINAMGMSKAMMEKNMIAIARNLKETKNNRTVICGVRYGNVLYSRGSVLPLFIDKLKSDKVLPITNPLMTRFLLPLPKAVDLVLFALTHGQNGYLYVRKAPASTMETLAQAVCSIFSYKKGYREVGIRSGEKIHETLVGEEELARAIDLGNYYAIPPESQGLDYNRYYSGKKSIVKKLKAYTSETAEQLNLEETKRLFLTIREIKDELRAQKKI